MEIIFNRRSIRKFTDEKVSEEKITKLLHAAMQAPSAGNQQAAEFVVVQKPELLTALASASPYAQPVKNAPLAIVLLVNENKLRFPENWQMDLAAATENILLEAVHLGLGGVWLGIAPLRERMQAVTQILKLPSKIIPFAIVPLGYPAQTLKPADRYQRDKVHFEQY